MPEKNDTVKKSEKRGKKRTVRQNLEKSALKSNKPSRKSKISAVISKPFKLIWDGLKIIFGPFKFLAKPFKTRPFKFLWRIFSTIFFLRYIRDSWRELRQVTWPKRKITFQLTLAVFIFAIFFGAIISVVDYGLDKLFKELLLK